MLLRFMIPNSHSVVHITARASGFQLTESLDILHDTFNVQGKLSLVIPAFFILSVYASRVVAT